MEPWAKRLQQLVNNHPASAIEISKSLGMSHSYINNLLNGHTSPSLAALKKFAAFFDTSVASFFTASTLGISIPLFTETVTKADAAIIQDRLAGKIKEASDIEEKYRCIDSPWSLSRCAVALLIEGATMAVGDQGYPPESIVFFEPGEPNDCRQQPTLFCKSGTILFRHFDSGYLRPLNSQFPAEPVGGWRPIARAVASIRLFPLPDIYKPGSQ